MEANNGSAFDIVGEVAGVEATDGTDLDRVEEGEVVEAISSTVFDVLGEVEGMEANDDTAADTVEKVEDVEYAPVAVSGCTEATFPVDSLPIPPAQNLEGFGRRSCCIVPRHWFDG